MREANIVMYVDDLPLKEPFNGSLINHLDIYDTL